MLTIDAIIAPQPSELYRDVADINSRYDTELSARFNELIKDATADGEPVSLASLRDCLSFLDMDFTKRPGIFLLDNGNFRLVWRNGENEQAAFQFRGRAVVHVVFFFKRPSADLPLSRETLVDLLPNVIQRRPDYAHLLCA